MEYPSTLTDRGQMIYIVISICSIRSIDYRLQMRKVLVNEKVHGFTDKRETNTREIREISPTHHLLSVPRKHLLTSRTRGY